MSERKVLNKYYPPDFDPSKIPRGRKRKNNQMTVRMMMPMSVRCNTCGEYLYKGKKFNSKKETVNGEEYLGVRIFRFYMKCTNCSAEFTIKTDPENSDYIAEMNCSRNFEPWRSNEKLIEQTKKAREDEEEGDVMKALENRTQDSKVEMDIIEALDEIRALNARNSKVTSDELFDFHKKRMEDAEKLTETEEDLLKDIVFRSSANYVKRLEEPPEENFPKKAKKAQKEEVPKKEETPVGTGYINVLSLPEKEKKEGKKPVVKVMPKIAVVNKKKAKNSQIITPSVSLVDYGEEPVSLVDY